MKKRMRLMTHNVWNCDNNWPKWAEKGEDCSAGVRVGALLRVYRETLPDIIGGQEVSALMLDLLKEGFQTENVKYTAIWGRFTPILYRADKFDLIDSEFGTYSERIEGLEGEFNDVKSKSWNLGVFRNKENGNVFVFATTHLWWMNSPKDEADIGKSGYQAGSDEARCAQIATVAKVIAHYREKYECPAILVGDMNTDYNSKAMTYLREQGFKHAHDIATEHADDTVGYHYCFASGYETYYYDREFETAIDHIYVIGVSDDAVKCFERYSPDYYFPISDHSAAYIDIEL